MQILHSDLNEKSNVVGTTVFEQRKSIIEEQEIINELKSFNNSNITMLIKTICIGLITIIEGFIKACGIHIR